LLIEDMASVLVVARQMAFRQTALGWTKQTKFAFLLDLLEMEQEKVVCEFH
jgi:hypothetical protein